MQTAGMRLLALAVTAVLGAAIGAAPVAGATSECDWLANNPQGGGVQAGNNCVTRGVTDNYIIDVRFNTDYPDLQPVVDFIATERAGVVNAAQAPAAKNLPYALHVTSDFFRSGQPTRTIPEYGQPWHGTASLVLKNSFILDPGVHGFNRTTYKSFNFDYDQNRTVTLNDLFAPGTNPVDSIYPAVAKEMARQQRARNYQLSPSQGRDPALYQAFAITDDTVTFFFGTGQLPGMPPEASYFFVPVSRANLPPLQI